MGYANKISFFLFAVLLVTAIFFFGGKSYFAQASFLDIIRALVTINPLQVSVSAPSEVELGKNFKVEVIAKNKGREKIENATSEIFLPAELTVTQKETIKKMGVITGKNEKKVLWQVRGEQLGKYIISVSVSGELKGDVVSAQGTTLVISVKEKPAPPGGGPGPSFRGFFDILKRLFKI